MIETTKPIFIVDIDGTLADTAHRLHRIRPAPGVKKNWPAFFEEAKNDKPVAHVVSLVNTMFTNGHYICLLTGRPDNHRLDTIEWMKTHGIQFDELLMRPYKDNRLDSIVKAELFRDNLSVVKSQILCAFEDRLHVAEMWRELGIPVLLCNDEWRGTRPSNESVETTK